MFLYWHEPSLIPINHLRGCRFLYPVPFLLNQVHHLGMEDFRHIINNVPVLFRFTPLPRKRKRKRNPNFDLDETESSNY